MWKYTKTWAKKTWKIPLICYPGKRTNKVKQANCKHILKQVKQASFIADSKET